MSDDLAALIAESDQTIAQARSEGEATAAYYRALIDKKVPATLAGVLTKHWLWVYLGGSGGVEDDD